MKQTVETVQSFVNPFHLEISQPPTSFSSGAAMPEKVRHDMLNALKDGKPQKEVFILDRLLTKIIPLFKRNKFKTMASTASELRFIESEGAPVQGHKWVHLSDLRQVASPWAASKHLRSDDLSPHSNAIFNGDNRWVLCENQHSARDELSDQRCY